MRVIVIGAGLGGPALANGLGRAGIDVAVHERDPSRDLRRQGYRRATPSWPRRPGRSVADGEPSAAVSQDMARSITQRCRPDRWLDSVTCDSDGYLPDTGPMDPCG